MNIKFHPFNCGENPNLLPLSCTRSTLLSSVTVVYVVVVAPPPVVGPRPAVVLFLRLSSSSIHRCSLVIRRCSSAIRHFVRRYSSAILRFVRRCSSVVGGCSFVVSPCASVIALLVLCSLRSSTPLCVLASVLQHSSVAHLQSSSSA
ncbi:hypothetical protein DEO72_LG11g2200 [Vigna unguiculata]|uniref:Uncharacterized protein n=1 Tax=Vigna unguiculata TaxID=3917 RepID=A0A4D6NQJ6_VIGUN|nr:hypothetical protein DEO72_LG11g2200 [Vigna unguiculata]